MHNELITGKTELLVPAVLEEAIGISALMVKHRYLQDISKGEVIPLQPDEICQRSSRLVRLFQIGSMMYENSADVIDRFGSVFSAIAHYPAAALYLLRFDGSEVKLYLGVGCEDKAELSMVYETFKGAFDGNFTGCQAIRLNNDENEALLADVFDYDQSFQISVASVSGTLEDIDPEQTAYRYGLERLIDGMRGERFDLVILADAVGSEEVSEMKDAFENLHSQLSPFCEQSISMTRGETFSYGETLGNSISKTLTMTSGVSTNWGRNWSVSQTRGTSQNEPTATNKAIAIGSAVLTVAGAGALAATGMLGAMTAGSAMLSGSFLSDPVARVLGAAVDERRINSSKSTTQQKGGNEGGAQHVDFAQADSQSENWSATQNLAKALSQTCQYTFKNRAIESLMETIDQRVEQIKHCESGGAYACAAYIIAADNTVANRAASLYRSALMDMGGKENNIYTNVWDHSADTRNICQSLRYLRHPGIRMKDYPQIISRVMPPTLVSAKDMPRYFMLPRKSLTGVSVQEHAPFARDIPKIAENESIHLGHLYHMGNEDKSVPIGLDLQSLTMHTFVTGTTGMGKSTVIFNMLAALREHGVKFMVIEPVKGEYKNVFGNEPDVHVYGTNEAYTPLLRINPFRFPEGIHVLEHMDGLIEILTVCWPLYAAMPAVLKKAVERAYEAAGWDLKRSVNRYGVKIYPSFGDVIEQTYQVLDESQYSNENKGNYIGSLCMRLEKLTTGIEGMIFTSNDLPDEVLFDENVIVDISRIRSDEMKALIMGMLVLKLQEYRQVGASGANQKLRHVTVLEEAHHLMRRNHVQNTGEGSAIAGKSVEMISNAIAEIRTYGEGFIIADQAPAMLDESVMRNTNTKIVLCLPDSEDRILTGQTMGLKDEQIRELSRLKRGVAAVFQNNWSEAMLVKLTRFADGDSMYRREKVTEVDSFDMEELRDAVVRNELNDWLKTMTKDHLPTFLANDIPTGLKCNVLAYQMAEATERPAVWSQVVYALFGSSELLKKTIKCQSVEMWKSCMLSALQLPAGRFSDQEINRLLATLLREMMLRDDRCSGLFCEYMEHMKRERFKER